MGERVGNVEDTSEFKASLVVLRSTHLERQRPKVSRTRHLGVGGAVLDRLKRNFLVGNLHSSGPGLSGMFGDRCASSFLSGLFPPFVSPLPPH